MEAKQGGWNGGTTNDKKEKKKGKRTGVERERGGGRRCKPENGSGMDDCGSEGRKDHEMKWLQEGE